MAYVFDYINNTLIDDEDKSLGNKFAVLDPDLEKVLQELNDKFGKGTIQEGTQGIPQPPIKIPQAIFEFEERMKGRMAEGGRVNFAAAGLALPALSYPASFGLAKIFGLSTAGVGATELGNKVTDYIQNNPDVLNDPRFKAVALTFGINLPGYIAPDADEMEKQKQEIEKLEKEKLKGTPPPKIDTKETFPIEDKPLPQIPGFGEGEKLNIPTSTGGSEIPEQTLNDFIFYNKKAPPVEKTKKLSETERGEIILKEEVNPETVKDIKLLIKDYRNLKTRKAGIYETEPGRERFKEKSTRPVMSEQEKVELIKLVVDKYNEKEGELPSATELKALLPSFANPAGVAANNNIKLKVRKQTYDRTDPEFIKKLQETAQLKAIENNNIVVSKDKNFYPKTITLKDGSIVNAEEFFINNLVKRTELGPRRPETLAVTLTDKQLAKLFNTSERVIKRATGNIKNSPDFVAEYPPNRPENYGQKIAEKRIKEARKYLTKNELTNVRLQEDQIYDLNKAFRDGTLVVTDYPNLVKALNTTVNKDTGILDFSIKKTKKEMIERSKDNSGLFDVSHTIPRTSEQQNIEFLRNRNLADYKTNQGLFKSFEAYVRNQTDDPEYDLRLDEFDTYMKEMGQRVKIGNRFFGLDEAMINSETGEFLGINRQLEYYGLPKFKNGVPLKKIKKATGGGVEITPLPRTDFNNGGAAGADENFLKELEFYFTNEDAELPKMQTYKETMNPIEVLNDIIDPRNYPYYADVLVRSGLRIGEFGARILPATGKLIADIVQKGPFRITGGSGNNYVQDYEDVLPSNIRGTGIFSEFLQNITPTTLEKKVGLDKLIKAEEQKQIERGSTAGPKVLADTIGLGAEVTAPIFPGLKLLNAFAKAKNLPNDKVTQKILEKEVDKVLSERGMNRREFLQATGATATVVMAKMLGLMDVAPKAAKVVRAAPVMDNTVEGMPAWFKDAVYVIERKGILKSRGDIKGIEPDFFEITLDTKLGKKKVLMSKNDRDGEITLDWTTSYYDMEIPVTITYKPGQSGKQNFLSDPEFPRSVEKYDVEVEAPEFEYKTVDTSSMGPEDTNFDSAINLDIKEEADAVVEALEDLGLGLSKKQKNEAAENFRYYNEIELDEGSGPDTKNPIDENDAFPFLDMIKRNKDK